MKLIDISLTNFKKISSIPRPTISLNPDINVLVGANNAGKTSLLKAVQKIFQNEPIDTDSDLNFLIKDGNLVLEANLTITNKQWLSYLQIALGSTQISLETNIRKLAEILEPIVIKLTRTIAIINRKIANQQINSSIDNQLLQEIAPKNDEKTLIHLALSHLSQTAFFDIYKTPLYLDSKGQIQTFEKFIPLNQIKNNKDQRNVNIRGLLYALKKDDPDRFKEFKSRLLAIFTELEDIDVRNNEDAGVFELVLHEKLKRNGTMEDVRYDINNVGQGMQTLVLMLSNILLLKPSIVLMDEPEVHMHPALIKEFVKYVKALSSDTQFIITTHSVVMMQEVGLDNLFALKNEIDKRGIIVNKVEDKNALLEAVSELGYPVDTLTYTLRPNVFVFTEGPSDKDLILAFAEKAGMHRELNSFTLGFIAMGGKGNRVKLANLIEKLNDEFIDSSLIMLLDRDETVADKIEDLRERFFKRNPKRLFYLSKRQIENYLINEDAINKIAINKIKGSELKAKWKNENLKARILALAELQREKILNNFLSELFITDSLISTKDLETVIRSIGNKPLKDSVPEFTGEVFKLVGVRTTQLGQKSNSAINEFELRWNNPAEKIEMCDGRELIKAIRRWFEQEYRIAFSDNELVEAMPEIPGEISSLLLQLKRPEELRVNPA